MSISVTTDIECDGANCPNVVEGIVNSRIDERRARQQAKRKGWVWRRDEDGYMVDLCPQCKPKEKK